MPLPIYHHVRFPVGIGGDNRASNIFLLGRIERCITRSLHSHLTSSAFISISYRLILENLDHFFTHDMTDLTEIRVGVSLGIHHSFIHFRILYLLIILSSCIPCSNQPSKTLIISSPTFSFPHTLFLISLSHFVLRK